MYQSAKKDRSQEYLRTKERRNIPIISKAMIIGNIVAGKKKLQFSGDRKTSPGRLKIEIVD